MKIVDQERKKKPTASEKPSRLEEARRIIEEYAADLREIIKQIRRKMN